MANIAVASVKNSFLDFNMFESIGGPSLQWTPFATEYLTRQVSNVYKTLLGEQNLFDGIARSSAVTRQFKPLFGVLKLNTQES